VHQLGGGLEMNRERELSGQYRVHRLYRPSLTRGLACLSLILRPADGQLAVARLAPPRRLLESFHELLVRLGADHAVTEGRRYLETLGTPNRHHEGRRFGRKRVETRILHGKDGAAIALHSATPEQPDNLNRFDEP